MGIRDTLISLFGSYEPVVDQAGQIPSGMAGVDWVWVAGAACFIVILISFFKILGALLK